MSAQPQVAIVILNYNGRNYLQKFLGSVITSSYAHKEIVVADNGSTDDSVDLIKTHFASVRLICLKENLGFAGGYNEALRQVKADYYVLLNSDVEVTPGWLEPLVDLMESDPAMAACQPKLLSYEQRAFFEYAGASGGWIDSLGYPFMRGRIFDTCEKDLGQYDDTSPCFWASGACLFIRASCFHEVGGFDPFFFAHQEEIDLCWRLQLAGYRIFVQPASVVYHVGGGTLPPGSRKLFLNYRNNLIMIWKNMAAAELLWKLPLRFLMNGLSAMREILAGRPGSFFAILKAHLAFLSWLLLHQKKSVFPSTRVNMFFTGWYPGSVVWDAFVRGRRIFSEIMGKV